MTRWLLRQLDLSSCSACSTPNGSPRPLGGTGLPDLLEKQVELCRSSSAAEVRVKRLHARRRLNALPKAVCRTGQLLNATKHRSDSARMLQQPRIRSQPAEDAANTGDRRLEPTRRALPLQQSSWQLPRSPSAHTGQPHRSPARCSAPEWRPGANALERPPPEKAE